MWYYISWLLIFMFMLSTLVLARRIWELQQDIKRHKKLIAQMQETINIALSASEKYLESICEFHNK